MAADRRVLPVYGNFRTMNLNQFLFTNIMNSQYYRVNLYKLRTYNDVVDEIYYQVTHLEPWERGSDYPYPRGGIYVGVRGVGQEGIPSTAFCLLFKLHTLRLTKWYVLSLINHKDSPYIRALGFLYVRFTQPPNELWDWYENYLYDEEPIDIKAGGGKKMSIGEMVHNLLTNQYWFSLLLPRLPLQTTENINLRLKALRPCSTVWFERSEGWRQNAKHDIHSKNSSTELGRPLQMDVSEGIMRERERQKLETELKKDMYSKNKRKTSSKEKTRSKSSRPSKRRHRSSKSNKH